MLMEESTTPFCPSSASFDGVSCAWSRVSGRPCVRCELSAYVCIVDSGTACGCVLSHSHVTHRADKNQDMVGAQPQATRGEPRDRLDTLATRDRAKGTEIRMPP